MNQTNFNFKKIAKQIPILPEVLLKLNSAKIKYGLYSGNHVAILTNNRISADVDFLVADEDFDKLKSLFPSVKVKNCKDHTLLHLGDNKEIEFLIYSDIKVFNSEYPYRLTKLCWQHTSEVKVENICINLLNPVDTILIKAMLQRGKDQGKHDLEDIRSMIQQNNIDKNYLKKRLLEVNGDKRVLKVLKSFNIIS